LKPSGPIAMIEIQLHVLGERRVFQVLGHCNFLSGLKVSGNPMDGCD
jgi:hypothetical protein